MLTKLIKSIFSGKQGTASRADNCVSLERTGEIIRAADCFAESGDIYGADAIYHAGRLYMQAGLLDKAESMFTRSCELDPANPEYQVAQGNISLLQQNYNKAINVYQEILSQDENNLAVLNNLALAFKGKGDTVAARSVLQDALTIDENYPLTLQNLGQLDLDEGKFVESIEAYTRLIEHPDFAERAYFNMAIAYRMLTDYDKASVHIRKCLEINPGNLDASIILGRIFIDLRKYDEADKIYNNLLVLNPGNKVVIKAIAELNLLLGKFAEGWEGYESRLDNPENNKIFSEHKICTDVRNSKPIALIGEQGIGDEILFASCIPDLLEDNRDCTFMCDERLERLFARSFPDIDVTSRHGIYLERSSKFSCYLPLGSLPKYYRNDIRQFPMNNNYLVADSTRTAYWQDLLSSLEGKINVGISWHGGTHATRSGLRSIELSEWAPILSTPDCNWISLQYGEYRKNTSEVEKQLGITINTWDEAIDDLDETAALVNALDIVISVSTSVVSLSGALGKKTFVMIPFSPGWIFLHAGNSMPWFSSVTLFRQASAGAWQDVIRDVASELAVFKERTAEK
jgi:tetratricopeptide (TPR) repeat protein